MFSPTPASAANSPLSATLAQTVATDAVIEPRNTKDMLVSGQGQAATTSGPAPISISASSAKTSAVAATSARAVREDRGVELDSILSAGMAGLACELG